MNKLKIAFFLKNGGLTDVDCRNLEKGNPGIGGSEYVILSVAYLLTKYSAELDVTLFAQYTEFLPVSLNIIHANDMRDVISKAESLGIETLSFRHDREWINDGSLLSAHKVKLIPWCHNFIKYKDIHFYEICPQLTKMIFVGKEQMELYLDTPLYEKMDYVFNGFFVDEFTKYRNTLTPFAERANNVTYIGSIIPTKGFHIIAQAWPQILNEIPDAQLYVIGGGKLYDRNSKVGKYGIASEDYESKFMKYLTDCNGRILPSVHFLGVLGAEKNDIIKHTKVGVPNPSGLTETFGITAVEMQMLGAKVITKLCPGYADTVYEKKSLYTNEVDCATYVINALKSRTYPADDVYDFCITKFSYENVLKEWERFYKERIFESTIHLHPHNIFNNLELAYKKIRIINRYIRKILPFMPYFIWWDEKVIGKVLKRLEKYGIKYYNTSI